MDEDEKIKEKQILAGKVLIKTLIRFVNELKPEDITSTEISGDYITVRIFRTEGVMGFVKLLGEVGKVAALATQHNAIVVFLDRLIFKDKADEQHYEINISGKRIDLVRNPKTFEIKTRAGVDTSTFGKFLEEFRDDMRNLVDKKQFWWFVFILKINEDRIWRDENLFRKYINSELCYYYLVVVEIMSYALRSKDFEDVKESTKDLIDKAKKMALEEDFGEVAADDEGFLLPVRNVVIVDELRTRARIAKLKAETISKELSKKNKMINRILELLDKEKEENTKKEEKLRQIKEELDRTKEELDRTKEELRKKDIIIKDLRDTVKDLQQKVEVLMRKLNNK